MRGCPVFALFLMVGLAAGCASSSDMGASVDTPIDTSIGAVKADPARYHQKFIRVRGVVNSCTRLDCGIEQAAPGALPAKDAAALGIGSIPEGGQQDGGAEFSGPLFDRLYRFAEVTVVGRYDASCDLGRDTGKPPGVNGKIEEIQICADRAPGLTIYRVLAVHKRWPATAFAHADDTLFPVDPAVARAVFLAYSRAMSSFNPEIDPGTWKPDYRVFGVGDEAGSALLCICRTGQCKDAWPSSLRATIPAPANPYACVEASRVDGAWRFPPVAFE